MLPTLPMQQEHVGHECPPQATPSQCDKQEPQGTREGIVSPWRPGHPHVPPGWKKNILRNRNDFFLEGKGANTWIHSQLCLSPAV